MKTKDLRYFVVGALSIVGAVVAVSIANVSLADVHAVDAVSEYNDHFGYSLATGDFNDDGFLDLAVGAPYEDVEGVESAGLVFLYRGTSDGLESWRTFGNAYGGLGIREPYDRFGWALAAGDFNGDGRDDLAVSAPWEAVGSDPDQSGAVFVYRSQNGTLEPWATFHQENIGLSAANERGDRFGMALAAGNFNGNTDGENADDLAIGAPGESPGRSHGGAVFILRGAFDGMTGMGPILTSADLATPGLYEQFGSSLATGNFVDTDSLPASYDDLAVGCYNCRVEALDRSGAVFLYEGRGGNQSPQPWARVTQWGFEEEGDEFGRAIAIADFYGSNFADIAVGAPGENSASGYVFIWESQGDGVIQAQGLFQQSYAQSELADRFGASLVAENVAGSSATDLLVGVPREAPASAPASGVVDLYRGSNSGLGQPSFFDQGTLGVNEAGDYFGQTLAAGDFDNDGCVEIAVGAPRENIQGADRAGAVFVFDCSASGPVDWLLITQEGVSAAPIVPTPTASPIAPTPTASPIPLTPGTPVPEFPGFLPFVVAPEE